MLVSVKRSIPPKVKKAIRQTINFSLDTVDTLLKRHDPLIPPRTLRFVGNTGDFKKVGMEFRDYFIQIGGLKPEDKVLDVGSGIGRMAGPLTTYVTGNGRYEGFDIVRMGVDWCVKNISARFPNFRFQWAEIYNPLYNPSGNIKASEYRFPYDDACFDFVYATSVFTHMVPDDVKNYLSEISRVMKPQARCLITFFLLNDESCALLGSHRSSIMSSFPFDHGTYRTANKETPEVAIAYQENTVRNLFSQLGLKLLEPVHYGSWCGRSPFLSYQDIVMAKKC